MVEVAIVCFLVAGAVCAGLEIAWGMESPEKAVSHKDHSDSTLALMFAFGIAAAFLFFLFL